MEDQIHPSTKRKRRRVLYERLAQLAQKKAQDLIGSTLPLLIEGVSDESELLWKGRLSTQAHEIDGYVLLNELSDDVIQQTAPRGGLQVGDFVSVQITDVIPAANAQERGTLVGTVVNCLT